MLISQNFTQDRRVVMDFRYLNVRIAKNNLAYQLVRDTFFSFMLDLKDVFHLLRLRRFQKILWYITTFWKCIIHISKNACGIDHFTLDLAILYKHNLRVLTK